MIRVWSLPAPNKGIVCRTLSSFSFAAAAFFMGVFLRKYDLVIGSVPNLATEASGFLIARIKGSKILLELRDLIPDNLLMYGCKKKSVIYKTLYSYYKLIYKSVDLIAVPYVSMAGELVKRGVDSSRILVLPHAADIERFSGDGSRIRKRYNIDDKFVVVYAGSMNSQYNTVNLIEAMSVIRESHQQVHLLLAGTGTDESTMQEKAEEYGLHNITFCGAIPPEEMGDYLLAADLFISSHHFGGSRPKSLAQEFITKDCEYLMAGKPVIVIESSPGIGQILENIESGTGVPISDPRSLAKSIVFYAENPDVTKKQGQNARKYAEDNLNREIITRKFEYELCRKLTDM